MKIYNTESKKTEDFKPINEKHIKMYVCGPTVYDFIHIGNARPIVIFDVLYRLLKNKYNKVTYVRNITDIDDKIINRAIEKNISIDELTKKTTADFLDDANSIGSLCPTFQPKATEYVDKMIDLIKILIKKKHAYVSKNNVLFNTMSWPNYGKFAKKDYEEQIAGSRISVENYKKNPADFILWKPAQENEPYWKSPWGNGRPGWHIECSAMATDILGQDFDIHGGGLDLIFPHHQNEIAQSCCAYKNSSFAKYWMHNGFVMTENEKMSKSLGNFYTVRDLLKEFDGEVIRFVILSTHYRQPLNFTKEKLVNAKKCLDKIYETIRNFNLSNSEIEKNNGKNEIINALENDLNTPLAIKELWEIRKKIIHNKIIHNKNVKLTKQFLNALSILGIGQKNIKEWFKTTSNEEINKLIKERTNAKKNKNYKEADIIRHKINQLGYEIIDTKNGSELKKINKI